MTVTLPIINGSTGIWGGILNTAITDIDDRLMTATGKNDTQDATLTSLTARIVALESAVTSIGAMKTFTSGTRPAPTVGVVGLETDTGYLAYGAKIGGIATWVPWPGSVMAKLRQTTAQDVLRVDGGATSVINFQVADLNRLSGWVGGARFTAPLAGLYECAGAITYAANGVGNRNAMLTVNGAQLTATASSCPGTASGASTALTRPIVLALNKNDYVELRSWQSSDITIKTDVATGQSQTGLQVKYMGYYGA